LKQELSQTVFNHPKIGELKHKLIGFATINDVRGNHKNAAGAADWLGWVERGGSRLSIVSQLCRAGSFLSSRNPQFHDRQPNELGHEARNVGGDPDL